MGMGSALNNQIVSLPGVQGGVGCSSLTALVSRFLAAKSNYRIGVLDGTPFNHSMLFSYLPTASPSHSLIQLEPYQDHLNSKLIEKYFVSVENITYIPTIQNNEQNSSVPETLNLISTISS